MVDAQDSRRDLVLAPQDGQRQRLLSWSDRSDSRPLRRRPAGALHRVLERAAVRVHRTDRRLSTVEARLGARARPVPGRCVGARPSRGLPGVSLPAARRSGQREGAAGHGAGRRGRELAPRWERRWRGVPSRASSTPCTGPGSTMGRPGASRRPRSTRSSSRRRATTSWWRRVTSTSPDALPNRRWAARAARGAGQGRIPGGWAAKDPALAENPGRSKQAPPLRRPQPPDPRGALPAPSELTGVSRSRTSRITPDRRQVAFDVERTLSYLYVLEGLSPGR